MKKSKKNILLGISVAGVCLFGATGVALFSHGINEYVALAESEDESLSASNFLYKGAAVRVIGEDITSGVRFRYVIKKDVYDNVLASDETAKTYVALSPLSLLNGAQIDKDNAQRVIEISDIWTEQEIDGGGHICRHSQACTIFQKITMPQKSQR